MHLFLVTYLHNKCFSGDLLGLNSLLLFRLLTIYVFLSVTQRRFYFDIFSLWNTFIYIGSCAPVEIPSSTIVFYGHKVEVDRNIRSASAFKCKRKKYAKQCTRHTDTFTHTLAPWRLLRNEKVCRPLGPPSLPHAPCHQRIRFSSISPDFGCFYPLLRRSGAKFKHFAIQAAPSLIVVPRYFCCKTASENKHLNENEKYV